MAEKFFSDSFGDIYCGDSLEVLKSLPDESVSMVITSPPYWGLRDYAGGSDIVWGGDEKCGHQWGGIIPSPSQSNWDTFTRKYHNPGSHKTTIGKPMKRMNKGNPGDKSTLEGTQNASLSKKANDQGCFCVKCGAWRGQLGLEPDPDLYVSHLMMIFHEVKRILRKDGSFYLNIADTYTSGKGSCFNPGGGPLSWQSWNDKKTQYPTGTSVLNRMYHGIPPKCMTMIPERVMFAIVEDGWCLRNKLIWRKPNSMPGSQKDRMTSSWEYIYFFTKSHTACLWRHRETGEWRDTAPSKEEKYPQGGMYRNPPTGEVSWDKHEGWVKIMPQWAGFDYYFELDRIRIPHTVQSLERYQRGVNLGRPLIGKSGEVGSLQNYTRAPEWFRDMFSEDAEYKGKFDGFFGHGPQPQSFNLRVRDVKRGKKGSTALTGELKASEEEVENYDYPEKHNGSSLDNTERLHRGRGEAKTHQEQKMADVPTRAGSPARKSHSGYYGEDGKPLVNFEKGKNPGDTWGNELWEITTKPSTISVCPKCDTVFKRYIKVCPKCGEKGMIGHFAPYPESLCINPILASSRLGDIVLDPFGGSGTTAVAAKRLGRKAILIDVVRPYCVMARYNLQKVAYQPELLTNPPDGGKLLAGGSEDAELTKPTEIAQITPPVRHNDQQPPA